MTLNTTVVHTNGVAVSAGPSTDLYLYTITLVAEDSTATVEIRDNSTGDGPPLAMVRTPANTSKRWVTADGSKQMGTNRFHVKITGSSDPTVILEYEER